MKKLIKIILVIAAIFVVVNICAAIVVTVLGKKIVVSQIEKNLKTKASIGSMSVGIPLSVTLKDLDIEQLARIESVRISPSLLGFLAGKVVLNEVDLVKPSITLVLNNDGSLNIPLQASSGKQPQVLLAALRIKDGSLTFIDKKIDPAGFKVNIGNIEADIAKNKFPPTSLLVKFNLSAALLDNQNTPRGFATASGWVDFGPKDMNGEIVFKDIEAKYLAPYYSEYISNKKLSSAKVNFTSDLKAKNNDLTALCHLEVSDIVYETEPQQEGGEQQVDIAASLMSMFSDSTNRIVFDFPVRTKLDHPSFDIGSFKKSMGQAAVQNLSNQSPDELKEKAKKIEEQFKDIGKAFKGMLKKEE